MTASPETFESLWAYCSASQRAIPRDWQKLYDMLPAKQQKPSGGWQPALPLILAAWHETVAVEKQLRFKEHVQWAADHNRLDHVGRYLRSLREDEWFHFGEL